MEVRILSTSPSPGDGTGIRTWLRPKVLGVRLSSGVPSHGGRMVRQAPAKRFYIDIRVRFPSVRPARLAQLVEVAGSKSVQSRFESEGEYQGRLTE